MEHKDENLSHILGILTFFQRMKGKLDRLLEPLAQAEGLTALQMLVLLHVAKGVNTVGAISGQTRMGQANASTLCKKLEQAGYLCRSRSARDERVVVLTLTELGRESLGRIQARIARYEKMLEGLPEQVMEELVRGKRAADLALDYLSEQIKGEQDPC